MLRFIINNFDLLAEEITLIYKKRWQIELISSHASRRYFIGNLFNNVQDPNLISSTPYFPTTKEILHIYHFPFEDNQSLSCFDLKVWCHLVKKSFT